MKKINLAIILILSAMLTSGCTKNYETVHEYMKSLDMKMKHPSYIIETKQSIGNKETNYRTYIMDEKWRTEKLSDDGNSYEKLFIYDGIDSLIYQAKSDVAILNYGVEDMEMNDEVRLKKINETNPIDEIIHWGNGDKSINGINNFNPVFINQNEERNGYKCRLIKIDEKKEACVSDRYGIAVYAKDSTKTTTVTNITKKYIPYSTFKVPEGVKKKKNSEI